MNTLDWFLCTLLLVAFACLGFSSLHALIKIDSLKSEAEAWQDKWREKMEAVIHLENQLRSLRNSEPFNFPVNVPELKREDQIALATFFSTGPGFLLLTRMNATLCNMAIVAAENKQFAGERACEARGYGEALRQIKSLSVVPTASDIPAPGQLDEAEIMLNKVSP